MSRIKIGKKILEDRHKNAITQDQLAESLGVSKSSVSKWETENSYPDILLLPELAALFNISVDELIGYEPQLTKNTITKLYHELAEAFGNEPEETYKRCEELIKKYNSCFPFLYQMAVLYLNHFIVFEHKVNMQAELLDHARLLCKRIQKESEDASLIKDTVSVEAMICLVQNQPVEVMQILGEEAKPMNQDTELIGAAYQQSGNEKRAKEVFQVCMYQHLLFLIQDSVSDLSLSMKCPAFCMESIHRISEVIDLYKIETLHAYTAMKFYLSAANVYAANEKKEEALSMVEKYTKLVGNTPISDYIMPGDDYFTHIEEWLLQLEILEGAPRGKGILKESLVACVEQNPGFLPLREEPRFRLCIERLKQF